MRLPRLLWYISGMFGLWYIITAAILTAAGCGSADHRTASSIDSWYAPPPTSEILTSLPKDRYAPVTEPLQLEAQAALAKVPFMCLSADEAARFAGKKLQADALFVLVRGVALNDNGAFDVRVNGKAVYVEYSCLGRRAVPMRRKALVAVLPVAPDIVYVSCGMAE